MASVDEAISFFGELLQKIDSHGTCFVIEALGENETDYMHRFPPSMLQTGENEADDIASFSALDASNGRK